MKTKKKSGKTVRKSVGEKSGNLTGIKKVGTLCVAVMNIYSILNVIWLLSRLKNRSAKIAEVISCSHCSICLC